MHALLNDYLQGSCGDIVYNCKVESIGSANGDFILETTQGTIRSDWVVNAAGLYAVGLAKTVPHYPLKYLPRSYFCKGNYFKFSPPNSSEKYKLRHLVYPVPPTSHTGLGIHATLDLMSNIRFGPDLEWLLPPRSGVPGGASLDRHFEFKDASDIRHLVYAVDANRGLAFYDAIRTYFPVLPDDSLIPDYSGIRPKLCGPNNSEVCSEEGYVSSDFFIATEKHHKIPGLVNCFGIESPGLTSSLSIADEVHKALSN